MMDSVKRPYTASGPWLEKRAGLVYEVRIDREGHVQRMKCFITGGAGFVGSNIVDRLLADGHEVTCYDNFSTGQARFLEQAQTHPAFRLVRGDLLDPDALLKESGGC